MSAVFQFLKRFLRTSEINYNGERIIRNKIPYDIWRLHFERYIFAKDYVVNSTILDVACGTGYGSNYLSTYAKEVIGGDISSKAITYSQNYYKKTNLAFFGLDAHKLPFQKRVFDAIVSFETIEHLPRPRNFVLECVRVLKKHGIFICSTYNRNILTPRWTSPLNPFHKQEFTQNEFSNLLRQHFEEVKLYGLLFLGAFQRFVSMFQHTLGFMLMRLKIWSIIEPFMTFLGTKNGIPYLSHDLAPRQLLFQNSPAPAYIIAVCMGMK